MIPIHTIKTPNYYLEMLSEQYLTDVYNILSDKEVTKTLNISLHTSINDTKKLFDDYFNDYQLGKKFPFAIIDKKTNSFMGVFLIKLDLYDDDCFEFTIYLNKRYWRKGIYSEILPYMVDFAFKDIKTPNLRGFVMENNRASMHILEKNNFQLEKIFNVSGIKPKIYSYFLKNPNCK